MIGFAAWIPKLVFLLVGLVIVAILRDEWKPVLRGRSGLTRNLLIISAFLVVWIALLTQLFVREFLLHHRLRNLRPDSVASIEINGRSLTDRDQIAAITSVLNRPQWFEVNHGGWADTVPLIVHLKSGEAQDYAAGFYLRAEGAVLLSTSSPVHGMKWNGGQVFYPQLPAVLARAGVTLPNCQSLSDGRFCTSCERPCPARIP